MGDIAGRIESLRREHGRLNDEVESLESSSPGSPEIAQMKKRKLAIKDELKAIDAR